ncbi:MAG: efflux RND transporter permease subunit [Rhodospirillaceae bacterium]|nr:efflux RND transporter permease subunit [Rhodospirillaceae bacterium]
MSALIDWAMQRNRVVVLLLVFLLITGLATYMEIPKESNPDIDIPIIYVSMSLDGVSPEDAERLMVRPMEEELRGIEGIKEMTATAYEGGANVVLEFDAGFDPDQAESDVRVAVDRVRPDLPSDMDEPTVTQVNINLFPIITVALSGDLPERTLLRLARALRDDLESLPSVLEVNIGGNRDETVEVIVDPLLIESYGINGADVLQIFSRSNRLVAAGTLDAGAGRFAVKVPGLIEDLDDILGMPIAVNGDAVVELRDIATIRRTFADRTSFARIDGLPAVTLEVVKRTGENAIETVEAIRQTVASAQVDWPEGVQVAFGQDASEEIRIMLTDLQNNVISAILLVMVVIIAVLGLRSALLVGLAIPGSFLTGILVLGLMGLTVNIVVLFALILAVGMLVDGAIVVVEFADRRMAEGMDRWGAYGDAAKRMAMPVAASTLTTLAAFFPLLFWPGVVGEFMVFLPITLTATLWASLAMALVFVPTVGALVGKTEANPKRARSLAAGEDGPMHAIGGGLGFYLLCLRGALRHPVKILLLAFAGLVGVWVLFGIFGRGVEFFPAVEPEQVIVLVHARGNLAIEEQDALVREVEERVLAFSDEFDMVYTRAGSAGAGGLGGFGEDVAADVIGRIFIEFRPWEERRPAAEIQADIRAATADVAGVVVETREPEQGPPTGRPVQVELASRDPDLLPAAVERVRDFMDHLPGLVDVEDDRPIPGIEWQVDVDRARAARFGLDLAAVGDAIKLVTNGLTVASYRPDDSDDEIDIIVRYPERWRTIETLDTVRVVNATGESVPISNFVERTARPSVGTLSRVDGHRVMTVQSDVAADVLPADMVTEIQAWLSTDPLPAGVSWTFRGEDEEQRAAMEFLSEAFIVAVFLIALILVTQFNSFYSAGLILSAVIMSTVGVLIGLMVTDQPFGIVMTGVGVIALAGIVVNNNIVLIDTYDLIRKRTADPLEAVLRTGAQRLRPVLMTTVTTILGLMPMVLRTNIDFVDRTVQIGSPSTQWWVSLATAVVFGLGFATILTLVVTPCALMARENYLSWGAKRRQRRAERRAARAAAREAARGGANQAEPAE